jgi:hypothetical protein
LLVQSHSSSDLPNPTHSLLIIMLPFSIHLAYADIQIRIVSPLSVLDLFPKNPIRGHVLHFVICMYLRNELSITQPPSTEPSRFGCPLFNIFTVICIWRCLLLQTPEDAVCRDVKAGENYMCNIHLKVYFKINLW